ncbi:MAG: ATP-binding protein, partial [Planctomycetota bacterium]
MGNASEPTLLTQITHWSQYFTATQDAILIVDLQGTNKFLNSAMEAMFGYSSDEVLEKSVEIFIPPSSLEKHRSGFEKMSQATEIALRSVREVTGRKKEGTSFQVEMEINRISQNNQSFFIAVIRDLTPRKKIEKELLWAKEAAEASSRSKSGFLANMSHELRTPLNSVIGFSNILLKNKHQHLTSQELTYLEKIQKNGNHLLKLINSILDLSKVEAGHVELHLETFCLKTLILEVLQNLESQFIEKKLEVMHRFPLTLEMIRTDREKLKQILINLIGNAIKFTEKGYIKIHIESDSEDRPTHIHVIDTGMGIPKEKMETIFEAFQQADDSISRQYGGTGLGLTISRALLELMGFSLQVRSTFGEGSIFTIILVKTLQISLSHETPPPMRVDSGFTGNKSNSIEEMYEEKPLPPKLEKKISAKTEIIQLRSAFANLPVNSESEEIKKISITEQLANKLILIIDDQN